MKKLLLSVTLITSPLLITSETCDEKFAKLGSFEPIVTSTQSVGANSGMLNSLSTFSGWGGPVGTKNPFNYFEFNVDPWDKMNPITQGYLKKIALVKYSLMNYKTSILLQVEVHKKLSLFYQNQ
jgi:hypothetical protein